MAVGRLRLWSTSASGNASGATGINWAEGQAAATVNNSSREEMAQIASQYRPDQWHWVEHTATASINSQTVFRTGAAAGNLTSQFHASRRVRLSGGSTTRYASVVSSSFTAETTVTISVDSGSLSASHSIVALGPNALGTSSPVGGAAATGATNTFTAPNVFTAAVGFGASVSFSATISLAAALIGGPLGVSATASFGGLVRVNSFEVSATASFGGALTGNITAGTYTPTLTNGANIASSTPLECQYLRVGSTVIVTGRVTITHTSASAQSIIDISLPIASNFGAAEDCAGTFASAVPAGSGNLAGGITASVANDRAVVDYLSQVTTASNYVFTFGYQVI